MHRWMLRVSAVTLALCAACWAAGTSYADDSCTCEGIICKKCSSQHNVESFTRESIPETFIKQNTENGANPEISGSGLKTMQGQSIQMNPAGDQSGSINSGR
jgi:hypothetical protein